MAWDDLPQAVVDEQVVRLSKAFPDRRSVTELDGFANELRWHLKGWTPADVQRAVSVAIASRKYFPTVSELLIDGKVTATREQLTEAWRKEQVDVCPRCDVHFYYAGFQMGIERRKPGVVVGKLRCGCRVSGLGWETIPAREWQPEEWMVRDGFTPPRPGEAGEVVGHISGPSNP